MNRASTDYVDELILSGAKAPDDALAIRCFDMAEGAIGSLLMEEAMSPALHATLLKQITVTRNARLPGSR